MSAHIYRSLLLCFSLPVLTLALGCSRGIRHHPLAIASLEESNRIWTDSETYRDAVKDAPRLLKGELHGRRRYFARVAIARQPVTHLLRLSHYDQHAPSVVFGRLLYEEEYGRFLPAEGVTVSLTPLMSDGTVRRRISVVTDAMGIFSFTPPEGVVDDYNTSVSLIQIPPTSEDVSSGWGLLRFWGPYRSRPDGKFMVLPDMYVLRS